VFGVGEREVGTGDETRVCEIKLLCWGRFDIFFAGHGELLVVGKCAGPSKQKQNYHPARPSLHFCSYAIEPFYGTLPASWLF